MALTAAALGWTLAPDDDPTANGSATVEAAAAHHYKPRPRTSPKPSTSATARPGLPGSTGAPGTGSGGTVGSPSPVPGTGTGGSGGTAPAAPKPAQPAKPPAAQAPAPPVLPPGGGGGSVPGGMSGRYANSMAQVQDWQSFRGSPVNVVLTFAARDSWKTITNPWVGNTFASFNGTWVISQPFFPTGAGDMNSCANGAYNSQWASFGSWLVGKGRPATIIRLAWEFNGNWFPWSVARTNPTTWVGCFRQVVSAIRSTDPQVRIDWTLNAKSGGAFNVYPGDQYVDIIGADAYDQWPASTDAATFDKQCRDATGLCSVIAFARQHGKQFSVPEWGLVAKGNTPAGRAGKAGGDNPVYIQKMYDTFAANRDVLAYESYFNDPAAGNVMNSLVNPNQNPAASAKYASLW